MEKETTLLMNAARVDAGVPVPRLARHLGVAVSTMTTRITGYQIKTLRVGDVVRICDALGADLAVLLRKAVRAAGPTADRIDGIDAARRNGRVVVDDPPQNSLPPVEAALAASMHRLRVEADVSIPELADHLGWEVHTTSNRATGYLRKSLRLADTVAICDAIGVDVADLLGQAREEAGPSVGLVDGVSGRPRRCALPGCRALLPKFDPDERGQVYMLATRRYCSDDHRWQAAWKRKRKKA